MVIICQTAKETSVTDPLNAVTRYTYDDLGRLTRTDYPDGTFTTNTLDGDDRVAQELDANGGRTIYGYDAAGRVVTVTDPMGYKTSYSYDEAGNQTRVTDPEGVYTAYTYDGLNRVASSADPLNNVTTYKYDACSNLTEIVHPLGHAEFFAYDSLHRKTQSGRREVSAGANLNVTTNTYDSMGNLLTTKDPMGNTTSYRYNLNNWLISVTDALNNVTSYDYDAAGNRITATNTNGHTTIYTYDKLNNVLTEKIGTHTTTWTYDPAGRMATKKEPVGDITTYKYDKMGRLTSKTYQDGSMVEYTYDGNGNRLSMDNQLGKTLYRYDSNNNLLEVIDCLGRKNTYTYDRANNRKTLTTSFGTLSYEYDTAARLSALTDFNGNRITLSYDPDSRVNSINYPQGGQVGYTYNDLDQVTNLANTNNRGGYNNLAYQYNGNDFHSLVTQSSKITSTSTLARADYSLVYDSLNRLTSIDTDDSGTPAYKYHNAFTYDNLGNRLTHNKNWTIQYGGHYEDATFTYDSEDRLSTKTIDTSEVGSGSYTYVYDSNGNQTKEKKGTVVSWLYEYDYENRISRVTKSGNELVRNLYNGDGQLMGVVDTENRKSTYYQYDGDQVIADLDGAGALAASYTRLPSGRLLDMYNCYDNRDLYYVFTDLLGSTVMLYGKNTERVIMYKYQEFGTYSTEDGSDPTRFTFTGAPYYSGPGLYQMGARYYNPAVGRFIIRDTYRGNIYEPWTQNLYAYCNNNPVNYIDPTGHQFKLWSDLKNGVKQVNMNNVKNSLNVGAKYLPKGAKIYVVNGVIGEGKYYELSDGDWSDEDLAAAALAGININTHRSFKGGSKTGYKLKPNVDLDFRGTGKTYRNALGEAFNRTGVPKGEFKITKWAKDANGKSFPVEWRAKNGAEVNIDKGHTIDGPDVPHVGYQTGGKRGSGGAVRGHILVDNVPVNR